MDTSFRDEYSDKRRIGLAVAEYRTSGLCLAGLLSLATKAGEHPCHDGRAAGGFAGADIGTIAAGDFEPPLNETPSTKLQRSSKSQTQNFKIRCRGKRRAGWFLSLGLDPSLELGDWELGALCWALSF